ncbi:MAG: SDR family oxidoreductase [Pyrinomonadaceae bacterium]
MILVLGSTGTTGREVARQLIAKGQTPRLFVRNREKAAEFIGNAEVVEGDLRDQAAVQSALEGVEKAYLVSAGVEGFELEKKFIDAAQHAGVRHIVKLSVIGADNPVLTFSRWHANVEKYLMGSDLAWTMLRPGHFATNSIMFWADTIKKEQKFYQPTGDGRWPSIDPADIASVAVRALTAPNLQGKGYTLTGSKPMNGTEYAEVLSEVLGKRITFVDIPPDVAQQGMLMTGMPAEYVEGVMNLMSGTRAGKADFVTDTFEQLMGRKPTSFDDWARRNIAAFQ